MRAPTDFQVLDEFAGIADLALDVEQLSHPPEVALVAVVADPAFLVLPVGGDALFGHPVHLDRANLHLERRAVLADHRRVQRLIAVRPGHGNEVLDTPRDRRPGLVDGAERGVAVPDALGDDSERHKVVHLLEVDLLLLQLLADTPEALDAAVDLDDGHLGVGELGRDGLPQLLDQAFGFPALRVHFRPERLVRLRLEIAEGQLLQFVLHLTHPEAIGNRGVDVAGFLGDQDALLVGQMVQGPHVMQAVGELDEDHADVVDHCQEHLAEVLRLALLAGRKGHGADLGHALDNMGDFGTEELLDALDGGQGVFDNVVEEAGGDRDGIELHVGEEVGDGERMDEVWLAGMAHLAPVLEGGEDVRAPEQLDVGVRAVGPDFFEEVLEANHKKRCLNQ